MKTLTNTQVDALTWAVREAEGWRGSLIGNPDPQPLQIFDAKVVKAKQALRDLKELNTQARDLNK